MGKYTVTLTVKSQYTVNIEVQALNENEAMDIAHNQANNELQCMLLIENAKVETEYCGYEGEE